MKKRLVNILGNIGIDTDFGDEEEWLENIDSLLFVSAIIEIEQEFGIEIPDKYLTKDQIFLSLDQTEEVVKLLINSQNL